MIVAHTPLSRRADIEHGARYNEWQVRPITVADLAHPILRERSAAGEFVCERRHVRTEQGARTVVGAWSPVGYGPSPATALESAWESQLDTAESVHSVHGLVAAYVKAQRALITEAQTALDGATVELSCLADVAQQQYEAELKKARLHKLAARGKADHAKVAAIRQQVLGPMNERKVRLLEQQREATEKLTLARALTFAQWEAQQRLSEGADFTLVPARTLHCPVFEQEQDCVAHAQQFVGTDKVAECIQALQPEVSFGPQRTAVTKVAPRP